MPALREQDFDKLASRVVDEFFSKRAKLADAAAQVAMENSLNPDQIERLSQSANTMAFLRMMEDAKAQGGQDLTQEFDPIDSRHVIRIVIDNTGVSIDADPGVNVQNNGAPTDPGMGDDAELPDEMSAMRNGPMPGEGGEEEDDDDEEEGDGDEEDEDEEDDDEDAPPKKPESPKEAGMRIMRLRKLAGILEDQRIQTDLQFEETYAKLATRFKRVYSAPAFESFEKDALAEHGDVYGVEILNTLRQARNLPRLAFSEAQQKTAALADRHISDDSEELNLFGTLVKLARDAAQLESGITKLRTKWT